MKDKERQELIKKLKRGEDFGVIIDQNHVRFGHVVVDGCLMEGTSGAGVLVFTNKRIPNTHKSQVMVSNNVITIAKRSKGWRKAFLKPTKKNFKLAKRGRHRARGGVGVQVSG